MTTRSPMALSVVLAAVLLSACSPTYNWREYASPDGAYRAMFPAKPASFTRKIDLDGMPVEMTMTAAEVDGATFAVGAAEAPDAARAQAALEAMRLALLRNIGAKAGSESAVASASTAGTTSRTALEVDALGNANGQPVHLVGHFEARAKRFYQAIVIGKPKAMPPEQVEQFLTSFKPQ